MSIRHVVRDSDLLSDHAGRRSWRGSLVETKKIDEDEVVPVISRNEISCSKSKQDFSSVEMTETHAS
jgi:hypothetical protein